MANKTANQILAGRLAHYMKIRGLSALALGKKAGIAPNTVGNYLDTEPQVTSTGKERSAKLAEVERLAAALGVSILDLLTEPTESDEPRDELPPRIERMLSDLAHLPESKQAQIIDHVHQMAEEAREAFAHLQGMQAKPPQVRQKVETAAARYESAARVSIPIRMGDGNPAQAVLPLVIERDPFNAEPSDREAALYERFGLARDDGER